MKATDSYRFVNQSPLKGIILYYINVILETLDYVELDTVIESIQTGKTPPKSQLKYYQSEEIDWYKPSDIGHGKYLEDAKEKFSAIALTEKKGTLYPKDTLLIIGIGGGVGRVSLLKKEGSSNQQITGISFNEKVDPEWGYYFFLVQEDYIKSQAKSMSFPILNQEKIKLLKFKYPPIEEQNEVCAFFSYLWDCFLSKNIPDLKTFNVPDILKEYALKQFTIVALDSQLKKSIKDQRELISNLKQSILQEAIQGKLTAEWRARHPELLSGENSAENLLKRIKAEKELLVKEKKIRKEKPLPPISEEEIPFELPEGWVWCRLSETSVLRSGNSYKFIRGNEEDIPYIKVGDMNIGGNFEDVCLSSTYYRYSKDMEKALIPIESIIFPKRGGAIATNKRCKVKSKRILIDSNTMALTMPGVNFDYLSWWFKTIDLSTVGNDSVIPQVNNKDILPLLFPLPTFTEQVLIAEKINFLVEKASSLEKEIATSEANAQMLMQAVLKEAFEVKEEKIEQAELMT